ncbi:outer membrane beta-barrel protein [Teredinibacter turnerae]|uniref:OmpA domain protein transmembrane region-containing protein n=1 Tax=Teredinibacter turnerae (strain ATCC 39867 / T7901) TaxID=377629 RepID=C5BIA3_TERTT|nr:outer membrane beta-barrel protein [Teredinibacter turnerae]ACR10695.1 OmpA domain protein transmembrane region-containing protein [Teredinibacter turnerae T7901]
MFNRKAICKKMACVAGASVISAAALTAPSVYADDTGFFIQGAYGGYKTHGDDFDDQNTLYELSAGYRFLPFLGVELGYTDLGKFGGDFVSAEVDGYSASVVGYLPFTESFNAFVELGQFYGDVDVQALDFQDKTESETPFYGIGVSFRVTEPLWITAEYDRYDVEYEDGGWPDDIVGGGDSTDVDTLKVGARYYF